MKPPNHYDNAAWLAAQAREYTDKGGLNRLSDFLRWVRGDDVAWVKPNDFHLAADANLSFDDGNWCGNDDCGGC